MQIAKLIVSALGINTPWGEFKPAKQLDCNESGITGDKHHGVFVPVGVQELARLRSFGLSTVNRSQVMRNGRQVSAIYGPEMRLTAKALGVSVTHVGAQQLSANILFEPTDADQPLQFSLLPQGTYLEFVGNGRTVLRVHAKNNPCVVAGEKVALSVENPDLAGQFPTAALDLRGVVLTVDRPGKIEMDDIAYVCTS